MNERMIFVSGEVGQVGQTLSTGEFVFRLPFGATFVYASYDPSAADTGLTVQLMHGTTGQHTAADVAAGTIVEVKTAHVGGSVATPAQGAAGTSWSLDFANAAADTRCTFVLGFLLGEK